MVGWAGVRVTSHPQPRPRRNPQERKGKKKLSQRQVISSHHPVFLNYFRLKIYWNTENTKHHWRKSHERCSYVSERLLSHLIWQIIFTGKFTQQQIRKRTRQSSATHRDILWGFRNARGNSKQKQWALLLVTNSHSMTTTTFRSAPSHTDPHCLHYCFLLRLAALVRRSFSFQLEWRHPQRTNFVSTLYWSFCIGEVQIHFVFFFNSSSVEHPRDELNIMLIKEGTQSFLFIWKTNGWPMIAERSSRF